jgi:F-type H+-transporting ATPase subunit a
MERLFKVFSISFFIFLSFGLLASTSANDSTGSSSKETAELYNPVPDVMHHISDAHDWHFFTFRKGTADEWHFSIPLPVILITEGNLDVFLSSAFHHGHETVTKGDRVYSIDEHGHISEVSDKSILNFSITKNVASMLLAVLILFLILRKVAKSYRKNNGVPKGVQAFIEPLILFVRDDVAKPNIGHNYKKYLPYLLTLFFFILINNLLGLLPGAANVTGNIALTLVLSVFTMLITNFSGNKNYWGHIFNPLGSSMGWAAKAPLYLILLPIEVLGIFIKPVALMIRLFANMTAGHIVILSLLSLILMAQSGLGTGGAFGVAPVSVAFVLFMYLIELLVAFLQAYIFTLLTSLFIGLAIVEDH